MFLRKILGAKTWILTERLTRKLTTIEMRLIRRIEDKTKIDRTGNTIDRQTLTIKSIEEKYQKKNKEGMVEKNMAGRIENTIVKRIMTWESAQ